MKREVVACSGGLHIYKKIARVLDANPSELSVVKFPDEEFNICFSKSLKGKDVFLVQSFFPNCNERIVETLIAGYTAKDLGARKVKLLAPYYPYLRQDKRFKKGECISVFIIDRLFRIFDEIVVLDPHLHRIKNIKKVIGNGKKLSTVSVVADYIKKMKVSDMYFIGPDIESMQWTKSVADKIGAPSSILRKERYSSRRVKIKSKGLNLKGKNVFIVDDIISSGHTMLETIKEIKQYKPKKIYTIGIHGLFCEGSLKKLEKLSTVISTNTIESPVSKIDISKVFEDLK